MLGAQGKETRRARHTLWHKCGVLRTAKCTGPQQSDHACVHEGAAFRYKVLRVCSRCVLAYARHTCAMRPDARKVSASVRSRRRYMARVALVSAT